MLLVLANSKLKLIDTGKGDKDIPDITVSFAISIHVLVLSLFYNDNLKSFIALSIS
jgi:hypothetical protein